MSEPVKLGSVRDPENDEIAVYADTDGTVTLRWEFGTDMVFGPVARDELRELLDRAAMPGQPCAECKGTGMVDGDGSCNCGSPADESVSYAHERYCGAEPCPAGCPVPPEAVARAITAGQVSDGG